MGLRLPEILIILVVLVLVFGANKIPQLGDALGKGIRNFKKSQQEDDSIDVTPKAQSTAEQSRLTDAKATAATPSSTSTTATADKKA